jgi:hypothetical protein
MMPAAQRLPLEPPGRAINPPESWSIRKKVGGIERERTPSGTAFLSRQPERTAKASGLPDSPCR